MVYVTEGSVELGVGQELYHLEKGDFGIVFPNVIHHYQVFGSGRNRDIVFVVLFFCALFLPMMDISEAESSIKENRRLAAKPDLNRLFNQKYQYGTKFEQWFSDRFYGRDWLVSLHSKINWGYSKTGNDRVLLGRDNWLFYKLDKNVEDYMNIPQITDILQEMHMRLL